MDTIEVVCVPDNDGSFSLSRVAGSDRKAEDWTDPGPGGLNDSKEDLGLVMLYRVAFGEKERGIALDV